MTSRAARVLGGAAVAVAATLLLASCSLPGGAPGASAPAPSRAAASASAPAATPASAASPASSEDVVVSPAPASTAAALATVTPFVSSATVGKDGVLDVSAIVPEIVESGGTCTVEAVNGSTTRSDAAQAVAASSYTGCEPMSVSGLTAGTWTVTVRYASAESSGVSAARTVTAG